MEKSGVIIILVVHAIPVGTLRLDWSTTRIKYNTIK